MAGSTVSTEGDAPRSVAAMSLWRAKWVILAVIVLAFLGGYQYSKDQAATYTSSSRVVLSAAQPFDPLGAYQGNDANRYVADQVALIKTQAVLVPAAVLLGETTPEETDLGGQITPEPSSTTSNEIVVNARGTTPAEAVARANAVADAYAAYQAAQTQQVVDATVAAAVADDGLVAQIRAKAATYGDGIAYVSLAADGDASSSVAPTRSAALITAVAALVAVGLALLWRTPLPDGSAVVGAANTRVLGTVPGRRLRRGAAARPQEHALPLVALDYARRDTPGPVLVTGSTKRSSAPAVAHGLAVSAAAQGRRVLLVDGDPMRREVARMAQSAPAHALEQLGRPGVGLDGVVVPTATRGVSVAVVGTDGSGLLDGAAVGRALDEAGAQFDLVLVQSGPASSNPVAFALVGQVAAVVLVARLRDSAKPVVALRERLETAGRPLVGVVLTGRGSVLPWSSGAGSSGDEQFTDGPEQQRPAPASAATASAPAGSAPAVLADPASTTAAAPVPATVAAPAAPPAAPAAPPAAPAAPPAAPDGAAVNGQAAATGTAVNGQAAANAATNGAAATGPRTNGAPPGTAPIVVPEPNGTPVVALVSNGTAQGQNGKPVAPAERDGEPAGQ